MKPDVAFVIAHYHTSGRVARDLVALIRLLRTRTNRIVVVSTNINESGIEALRPFAKVIARENFGYDFWSYRVGIEALGDLAGLERLVIFNSSFVTLVPKALCKPFLGPVDQPCMHGLTRCDFGAPHLQSFWIAFEHADLIRSAAFENWWRALTPVSDRKEVIRRYEIGMSAHFASAGVQMKAAFRPTSEEEIIGMCRIVASRRVETARFVDQSAGRPRLRMELAPALNPTHFLRLTSK